MPTEPAVKRATFFIDGQNLLYAVKNAFGYAYPNYDVAAQQGRWIKIASAFPSSPASLNRRGINGTDWVKIDRVTYDACLDPRDYRPKLKT